LSSHLAHCICQPVNAKNIIIKKKNSGVTNTVSAPDTKNRHHFVSNLYRSGVLNAFGSRSPDGKGNLHTHAVYDASNNATNKYAKANLQVVYNAGNSGELIWRFLCGLLHKK